MIVFIVLLLITQANSAEKCFNIDVSITQNIENNGFHNKLNIMLEFQSPDPVPFAERHSRFALHLNVSSGMFINPDELSDLMRLGKLFVYIDRNVNIETSENESEHHNVFIFVPAEYDPKIVLRLPVHLRYHSAQIGGGFVKVPLPKLSLLVLNENASICNEDYLLIEAPCTYENFEKCLWGNISYEALFKEVELLVPIGNLEHFPIVAITTLVLGCIGCMYILSILSTCRSK